MRIVFFGLSISSAWGNGHASLLRGLFRSLHAAGHHIDFFERDTPYYASHRDADSFPYATLHLYSEWASVEGAARRALDNADAAVITSYCPDGREAAVLVLDSGVKAIFYDMDTPVTLDRVRRNEVIPYLPANGLRDFDLVLSYTGGEALRLMSALLGANNPIAFYGWVDADEYRPVEPDPAFSSGLSYLGTYSADRQDALEELLLAPARSLPNKSFLVAGALYPDTVRWPANVRHLEHVAPPRHCQFYCSSPLTLNITRGSMARLGYCPSGRLFEAAACGTALLSDSWEGLETFFTPGEEILIAHTTDNAIRALSVDIGMLEQIARRARQRVLDCHTARHRASQFISLLESTSHKAAPICAEAGGSR